MKNIYKYLIPSIIVIILQVILFGQDEFNENKFIRKEVQFEVSNSSFDQNSASYLKKWYKFTIESDFFCGTDYKSYFSTLRELEDIYIKNYKPDDKFVSLQGKCQNTIIRFSDNNDHILYYGSTNITIFEAPKEKPKEEPKTDTPSNIITSSQIYYWIQDRYEYYDDVFCGGSYCGDKYEDRVFSDAARHFKITVSEVRRLYNNFRY